VPTTPTTEFAGSLDNGKGNTPRFGGRACYSTARTIFAVAGDDGDVGKVGADGVLFP
jgi:hypothetical protein